MTYKAVGIHVFAGAFTMGVQRVFDVECQLEQHGFGRETVEEVCKIPFVNHEDANWPDVKADFCYGNPRCTGFSCITAGYGDDTHGPWAKQTQDIHGLCNYAVNRFPIIIWESVQQAYSVGRPLLDYLRDEIFAPNGYRVAHILLNAASMGNSQQRKRYFFVAYKGDRNFNISPPTLPEYQPSMYDAIWDMRGRTTRETAFNKSAGDYDADSYIKLTKNEKLCVPLLPNGWNLNMLAKYATDDLPREMQATWRYRSSEMPFSMHCIFRTNWMRPAPTLHSSAVRFIHPYHNRPLTIGELSKIMGWPDIPRGPLPAAQIAKGVCPEVGEWLAQQAKYYLDDVWGNEDWESSYNPRTETWEGRSTVGEVEKVFNMNNYIPRVFDRTRFDVKDVQHHRFNVDPITGRPVRPWKAIAESSGEYVA